MSANSSGPSETIVDVLATQGINVRVVDPSVLKERVSRRPTRLNVLNKNLLDLKSILDRHGIPFFLIQGTLLAAVRDGRFFEHSIDVDLCAYWDDRYRLAKVAHELATDGFFFIRYHRKPLTKKITLERGEEIVDLQFLELHHNNSSKYWKLYNRRFDSKFFDKGDTIRFLDQDFRVPYDYVEYLGMRYGKHWHTRIYKLHVLSAFDRIRNQLDSKTLVVAPKFPLWPLRGLRFAPVSISKTDDDSIRGRIALIVSGKQICLRYVHDTREDGMVKVSGGDSTSLSVWHPSSSVLACATKLHFKNGLYIPLNLWFVRMLFRLGSVATVASKRVFRISRA